MVSTVVTSPLTVYGKREQITWKGQDRAFLTSSTIQSRFLTGVCKVVPSIRALRLIMSRALCMPSIQEDCKRVIKACKYERVTPME
nr:hypothetical protein [Tanacetum cinerariifolium]